MLLSMKLEITKFLEDLKNNPDTVAQDFAIQFNATICQAIAKMINNIPVSSEEIDIIKKQGCTKYISANELMKSPNTPPDIKEHIVNNIINNKIGGLDSYNLKRLLNTTFKNYPEISTTHIEYLFNHHYEHSLFIMSGPTSLTISKLSPYCDKVLDGFSKLFLDVLNHKIVKPMGFDETLSPLHIVASHDTHEYIINNMPKNIEIAEYISTQLIDNPYVDENIKNQLFDIYGYNYSNYTNSYATPYIVEKLYKSAIDTIYNFSGYTTIYNETAADNFLRRAIKSNILPEAIQIDFVNRILSEAKAKGNRKINNFLSLFNTYTDSPKVLHIIFEQAPHVTNRDDACLNKNISKEDLQKRADIYCNKIQTMLNRKTPEKISDKWIDEIHNILKYIPIKEDQYQMFLNSGYPALLSIPITHSNTPSKIVAEATTIIEKQLKETNPYVWEKLLFSAKLHTELLNKNCCSQEMLDYTLTLYHNAYQLYKIHNNLKTLITGYSSIYKDIDSCNKIIECFKNVFQTEQKGFFDNINSYITDKIKENELPEYKKINSLETVDIEKIKYRLERNIDNFRTELRNNNAFSVIEKHAHRHNIFSNAIIHHLKKHRRSEISL